MRQNQRPFLGKLFQKLAPKIGAKVILEPRWGVVGKLIFKNGRVSYFRNTSIDLNSMGASSVATDKDYTSFFLKKAGYPTIPGTTFFAPKFARAIGSSRSLDAAVRYARRLGYPVIVKPNSASQGKDVSLVYDGQSLARTLRAIFTYDNVALVQTYIRGNDYRIVVLDGQVISAYQRIPLAIVGDGKSSIKNLLTAKQKLFVRQGRDTRINFRDPRIHEKLRSQSLSLSSVPATGARIFLLDNANLSTGGDAIDVTSTMHPIWKKIACSITKDMGLRFCGVDLMIRDTIADAPKKYWVIEVNSAPGLDHYASAGRVQNNIVENMYVQVLRGLEK